MAGALCSITADQMKVVSKQLPEGRPTSPESRGKWRGEPVGGAEAADQFEKAVAKVLLWPRGAASQVQDMEMGVSRGHIQK